MYKVLIFNELISCACIIIFAGPLEPSAVWIDESQTVSTLIGRNRGMSPLLNDEYDDPLGICDESNEYEFYTTPCIMLNYTSYTIFSFLKN